MPTLMMTRAFAQIEKATLTFTHTEAGQNAQRSPECFGQRLAGKLPSFGHRSGQENVLAPTVVAPAMRNKPISALVRNHLMIAGTEWTLDGSHMIAGFQQT